MNITLEKPKKKKKKKKSIGPPKDSLVVVLVGLPSSLCAGPWLARACQQQAKSNLSDWFRIGM